MIVRNLANYAAALSGRALPEAVRHAARRCIIDWFAAVISGAGHPPATLMVEALDEELGHGSAQLIPLGRVAPIRTAALINAAAAHTMEVDDIFREGIYHPGPPVIAAALAAAQGRGHDGRRLLEAVIAGYEVSNRVARAVQPAHYDYWHTTGTIGTIGAATAAAVGLGLDGERTFHAIANSVTMAGGLQQAFSADAMGKPLHAGHAAEAGALAAILAEKGMTGAPGMLDGGLGFGNAMSRDVDWNAVSASLADEFTITAMTQKNHTCCGHTFAAIDAVLALKAEHDLTPGDIAGISVATYGKAVELCGNADPQTVYETKFSLPYAVAVALVTGAARFDAFRDERLRDREIRDLMARVTTVVDAEAEAAFPGRRSAMMRIETNDGRSLEHYAPTRKGDPDNPLSDDELVDKYRELVTPVIDEVSAEALLDELWRIDEIADLARLSYQGVRRRQKPSKERI